MSASLSIHIFEGITEEHLKAALSPVVGSKYFMQRASVPAGEEYKAYSTESVWVGEVSFLKAALTGDDSFIPPTVDQVNELIGENLLVVDDILITRVREAFSVMNMTEYEIAKEEDVINFLENNKGKQVYTLCQ